MDQLWQDVLAFFSSEQAMRILRAVVLVAVGLLLARLLSSGVGRLFARQADAHQQMLARRLTFYLVAVLFLLSAFVELGFNLSVLLGAAGILTVALGFASQTSASNIITRTPDAVSRRLRTSCRLRARGRRACMCSRSTAIAALTSSSSARTVASATTLAGSLWNV